MVRPKHDSFLGLHLACYWQGGEENYQEAYPRKG